MVCIARKLHTLLSINFKFEQYCPCVRITSRITLQASGNGMCAHDSLQISEMSVCQTQIPLITQSASSIFSVLFIYIKV